jgi:hypothetical protein
MNIIYHPDQPYAEFTREIASFLKLQQAERAWLAAFSTRLKTSIAARHSNVDTR